MSLLKLHKCYLFLCHYFLSKNPGKFKGGFILENNGIEINSTYEALVSSLRDELEFEVAKVLFN